LVIRPTLSSLTEITFFLLTVQNNDQDVEYAKALHERVISLSRTK
jgi:hypothetical protein